MSHSPRVAFFPPSPGHQKEKHRHPFWPLFLPPPSSSSFLLPPPPPPNSSCHSLFPRLLDVMMLRLLVRVEVLARKWFYVERIDSFFGEIPVRLMVGIRRHFLRSRVFLDDFCVWVFLLFGFRSWLFYLWLLGLARRPFVLHHAHSSHFHRRRSSSFQIWRGGWRRHGKGRCVTLQRQTGVSSRSAQMKPSSEDC